MHEIVPRSKTRGLPPEERFNLKNCIRLSRSCHRAVTEHRKWVHVHDAERGGGGPVTLSDERA
jgi:5-methylcytosine-specific restriction endonuclease McrA